MFRFSIVIKKYHIKNQIWFDHSLYKSFMISKFLTFLVLLILLLIREIITWIWLFLILIFIFGRISISLKSLWFGMIYYQFWLSSPSITSFKHLLNQPQIVLFPFFIGTVIVDIYPPTFVSCLLDSSFRFAFRLLLICCVVCDFIFIFYFFCNCLLLLWILYLYFTSSVCYEIFFPSTQK